MTMPTAETQSGDVLTAVHDEIGRLREANAAFSEALRNVEAMAWFDIAPTNDPREVCQTLAGKIRDTGDIQHIGVFLTDPVTLEFAPGLMVPEAMGPRLRREFEQQLGAGMIGWTVRERRLVAVPALTDPEDGSDPDSVIIFPISTTRRVWGVAVCFAAHDTEDLPQNALRLLNIVANHFGMAIENASLMHELADQNRDLEVMVQKRTSELQTKNQALERAYEELRRVDAAKDDFISLVAHELRTPLTSILSFSEFLGEEGLAPEEIAEFSRSIKQEATRLHLLVNDVLDLAKMEAGKLVYRYSEEDLNAIAEVCINGMAGHAAKRRIQVKFQKDEALPAVTLAPDRIQQVIQNMISNALKYSEEGSEVIVSTRHTPDTVTLEVRDFGVGIAARDIPKVFNKFERIEDVKHHAGGTGFGMPISMNIIESGHGGKMWVESEGRGKGAVFYFIIPKQRDNKATTAPVAGRDPG
jgi:signal transduction histidine kinase